jgi:hypothetical protein
MNIKKQFHKTYFSDESISKGTLNVASDKTKKIPAIARIGKKIVKTIFQDNIADISPSLKNTPKIGVITYINEKSTKNAKHIYAGQRQGKDKKNLFHLRGSLLPHITINADKIASPSGELNYNFSINVYGQSNDRVFVRNNNYVPFNDRLSKKFSPKEFIEFDQSVIAYPNLTNGYQDFINYKNPDSVEGTEGGPERNGTIDVFGVVTSLMNTSMADIQLLGVRCNYGIIDQETSQYDMSRGSSVIDSKYEFKQGSCVYFEDSQDMALNNPTIELGKTIKRSEEGILSNSTYTSAPFDDRILNENNYQIMTNLKTRLLLSSSNTNFSEIGTRYKSMCNGLINNPFYTSLTQNNLITDAISFRGLLRG